MFGSGAAVVQVLRQGGSLISALGVLGKPASLAHAGLQAEYFIPTGPKSHWRPSGNILFELGPPRSAAPRSDDPCLDLT